MSARVEGAGNAAAATADHARERVNTSLEAFGKATEDFEQRLDKAGDHVSSRVNEVQDIAVDVELRLQAVTDKVLGGMEKFRHDVEGLEGRSAELSEHMTTQGSVLKELAELAAADLRKLKRHLKRMLAKCARPQQRPWTVLMTCPKYSPSVPKPCPTRLSRRLVGLKTCLKKLVSRWRRTARQHWKPVSA